ncbi:MAG: 23S rRNA (uracil(1939)-C(5))-methyltransferase RlmD [Chitinophagales bacterium]|nr:23S rRNA (uracil(1939)-C(5))-methyltransferase RlmD [Chitinophagales bacterium]
MGHRKIRHKVYEELEITGLSSEGLGIARVDEKVVFVEQCIPGDVVRARTFQRRKNFEKARILALTKPSIDRQAHFCKHFESCGGCKWQYLPYAKQIAFKDQIVSDAFARLAKVEVGVRLPILPAKETEFYRNKLEYTFSTNRWFTKEEIATGEDLDFRALGFHVPGQHTKVVDIDKCYLQNEFSNKLRNAVREYALEKDLVFYNIKIREGFLRNLVVRTASTGEILVILIVNEDNDALLPLMAFIKEKFPEITSLNYIINPKLNDTYFDQTPICYSGKSFIIEKLGKFSFKVRPKSFFQTNTSQGERLYDVVKNFAALQGTETLYDLYAGVGSIGLYLSDNCNKLVGIEQIDQAVEDAKENAKLNAVENADFHVGDVRLLLNADFLAKNGQPDILITDPPRGGMHPEILQTILKARVPKIVYVSCNPSTQARDIAALDEFYKVVKMQAIDMFPHTVHIENVALLELK